MQNKRIIFATPPYHCGVVEVAGSWTPLGFLYLGAQAKKAGWTAEVYDAMTLRYNFKDIRKKLEKSSFDVFATTAITPTFPDAVKMCKLAKEVNPKCVTIIGGVHPTFCYDEIFEDPNCGIDYIFYGEGEIALYKFLLNFDDKETRDKSPNLIYSAGGELIKNNEVAFIDDLDSLPVSWELLNWSDYKYYVIPGSTLGSISTSRGCSHSCTFCSQQRFWKKTWRGRKPDKIAEEIMFLNRKYGVNVFLFTDEYPTYDRDRWEELLDRIISASLDIYILIETRVEDIVRDKDILKKYRKAGIVHIYVGAEATDQATLDKMNKDIEVTDSSHAIDLIAENGMISETSFILGFPDETKESIEKTFLQAKAFNADFAHFLAITPWPYSELYAEVKDSIAVTDYSKYNLIEPIIKPAEMTLDDIDLAIIDCYRRYYMPKMLEFLKIKDKFRRDYLVTSTKLIMKSSFLISKFARLGINPRAMMQNVLKS